MSASNCNLQDLAAIHCMHGYSIACIGILSDLACVAMGQLCAIEVAAPFLLRITILISGNMPEEGVCKFLQDLFASRDIMAIANLWSKIISGAAVLTIKTPVASLAK